MVAIRHGSLSITGNFRENNEDRCLVDDEQRFFLVCDGMGGQAAGEKASELAIEIISEQLRKTLNFVSDTPEAVQEAVNLPVYDFMTMVEFMFSGLVRNRYCGHM